MRLVLATNFQILDEERSFFWNSFSEKLSQEGMFLLVLTTNVHEALKVPYVEIPYTLAGFCQFAFDPPPANGFFDLQLELEASWQTADNMSGAERGIAQCAAFFGGLLDLSEPVLVLSWNTLLPQSRILQIACAERCIPCQTIEQGLLPGTLLFDPTGNHLDASLDNSFAIASVLDRPGDVSDFVDEYRAWFRRRGPAKYRQSNEEDYRRLRAQSEQVPNTILILGPAVGTGIEPADQMLSRRTLPAVADRRQIVEKIAEVLIDQFLIFRDHPINQEVGMALQLPANVESGQDASLYDYLQIADHVIVLGGTTAAYECLVMEKPVMVIGRNMLKRFAPCRYSDGADLDVSLAEFVVSGWDSYAERADHILSFLLDHYLVMLDPALKRGNQLDDLVGFISNYDTRNTMPDEERSERLLNWIQEIPREGL